MPQQPQQPQQPQAPPPHHRESQPGPPHKRFKRGARPTPHERRKAAPKFPSQRAAPPPQLARIPKYRSMYGNDQYGDCVSAEEAFAASCWNPTVQVPEKTVIDWARSHGVLEGASLDQVLDWMAQKGFSINQQLVNDGPKSIVDFSSEPTLRAAISLGPVKIAIAADALSGDAGNRDGWYSFGSKNDHNTDHAVSLCGYGRVDWLCSQLGTTIPSGVDPSKPAYLLYTWSTIGLVDHEWIMGCTDEAWARTPPNFITGTGGMDPTQAPPLLPGPPPPPPTPPTPMVSVKVGRDLSPGGYQVSPTDQPLPPEPGAADLVLSGEVAPGTYCLCPSAGPRAHLGTIPVMYYLELAMWAWSVLQALLSGAPIPPPPAPPAHV